MASPTKRWLTVAGAAWVLLVLVAALAVAQWSHADSLDASAHDRVAAEKAAGTFSQDLLTIDSSNPDPSLDRLKTMATVSYQPKIAAAQQAAVAGASASVRTTTTASTEGVFLTDITGGRASAVCEERWLVTANGRLSPPLDFYVKIDLRKVSGSWKVNGVVGLTAVAANSASGG